MDDKKIELKFDAWIKFNRSLKKLYRVIWDENKSYLSQNNFIKCHNLKEYDCHFTKLGSGPGSKHKNFQ